MNIIGLKIHWAPEMLKLVMQESSRRQNLQNALTRRCSSMGPSMFKLDF